MSPVFEVETREGTVPSKSDAFAPERISVAYLQFQSGRYWSRYAARNFALRRLLLLW